MLAVGRVVLLPDAAPERVKEFPAPLATHPPGPSYDEGVAHVTRYGARARFVYYNYGSSRSRKSLSPHYLVEVGSGGNLRPGRPTSHLLSTLVRILG